jgi:hypothetical protein
MAVLMHDTDEGMTVLPIHLSGVKSDENVAAIAFFCQESCLLENSSVLNERFSLVRMSAAMAFNLADTCIREAIACCTHVLRVGKGFI